MLPAGPPRFLLTELEITFAREKIHLRARVGVHGLTRLEFPCPPPLRYLEARAAVKFGPFAASALFFQCFDSQGTSHGARFLPLELSAAEGLLGLLQREGEPVPWQRAEPRHPSPRPDERSKPYPRLCHFHWFGRDLFLETLDFSANGLRLRWPGNPCEISIGQRLPIRLYTQAGEEITRLEGEVRHVCRWRSPDPSSELGLRFLDQTRAARGPLGKLLREFAAETNGAML